MMTMIWRRATIIGKMRYYFLDRHASLTIRVLLIGLCLMVTLLSMLLLRGAVKPADFVKGMLPAIVMVGVMGFVFVYSNMQLTAVMIFIGTMILSDGVGTGTGTKITFTFIFLNAWALIWFFKLAIVDRSFKIRPSTTWFGGAERSRRHSSAVSWKRKSSGKRARLRFTACTSERVSTP